MDKPTKDLMNELVSLKHKRELDQWIEEHKHENKSFGQYFQELCRKYNTNPSQLSGYCGKSKSYLYKCSANDKIPSKKVVVLIGIALKATLEEINTMLKCAGHKELYPKNMWDAIIIFGLNKGYNIYEIDGLLREYEVAGGLLNEEENREKK